MLFNSIEFLVFFISVFTFYWIVSKYLTIQNLLLLISSYIFYAWWDWRFLSLIIFSSFLDYWVGLKVAGTAKPQIKYRWLIVSLVSNLGLLGVFKYYNFFTSSFQQACRSIGWQIDDFTLEILLPVGISFYTFQTLSYTIDIYRGNIEPTKSILSFFTYYLVYFQVFDGPTYMLMRLYRSDYTVVIICLLIR